jgi:hypothetical protein
VHGSARNRLRGSLEVADRANFLDNPAVSPAFVSRRTWLWASTTAFAAACARPEPSKLPDGGPESARVLTRRGAENLIALAELGTAVRWLHPSDQVVETEWEPLLLDGVRGLEGAATSVELLEGLRGLLAGVAPTLLIWQSGELDEDLAALDMPACPEPSDETAEPGKQTSDEPSTSEQPDEAPPVEAPPAEDRARPPVEKVHGPFDRGRPNPPSRTKAGASSDRKQAEDAAKAAAEAEGDEKGETGETGDETGDDDETVDDDETGDGDETGGDDETGGEEESGGEGETGESSEPEPQPPEPKPPEPKPPASDPKPSELEGRPPLPDALFEQGAELEITQWHRRGFSEGLDEQPGCALRIHRRPDSRTDCSSPPPKRKRKRDAHSACSSCDGESYRPLAPGAPAQLELPRALASAMPVALWTRDGRTLPAAPPLEPAPAFDERRAWDYDLADRGTRLLAVMRTHSLLQRFHPHSEHVQDPRESLLTAMCTVADDDSPLVLHETLERLLAAFGDGNAELRVAFGKPARRWMPELSLRWIEERVVVAVTLSADHARAGDVVTAIDGVAIDELLARELGRTAAARPGAAIERTVARLLARRDKGATIELDVLRAGNNGEEPLTLSVTATHSAEHPPMGDARPSKPIVELREGLWYVDATRVHRLDAVARRLRRADRVILDLRGPLADPSGSLCAHLLDEPLAALHERVLAGPDAHGQLSLASVGDLSLEPRRPRMSGRVVVLADSRTRGRAELELACFDHLGSPIVGSASAGDLGTVAHAWLPGGWQLRFTTSELRHHDGSALWGQGIRASVVVDETLASVRAGEDLVLRAAQAQFDTPG